MSYQNLLNAFEDASIEANCGLVEKSCDPAACFKPGDNGRETFNCIVHCKDWKWRSTSSGREGKRINILLRIAETIRRRDQALLTSVVQVNYLSVDERRASLLQAFHFDYNPCQRDHALFHAQLTDECFEIPSTDIDSLKIDFAMPERATPRIRCARIPTCDMTFPSVLVCLAADHIGGVLFQGFRSKASELQKKMPYPLITKLKRSLGTDSMDLRSSHWFAHFSR